MQTEREPQRGRGRERLGRAPMLGWAVVAALGVWAGDSLPDSPGDVIWRAIAWGGAVGCLWVLGTPRRFTMVCTVWVGFGALHHARQVMAPGRRFAEALPSRGAEAFDLCGRVAEPPRISRGRSGEERVSFSCKLDWARRIGRSPGAVARSQEAAVFGAHVWVHWAGTPPPRGARVWIRAAVSRIPAARNPGQWDAAGYFCRQGLWAEAQIRGPLDCAVWEWPSGFDVFTGLEALRAALVAELGRGLEDQPVAHALVASMVLGLRGEGLEQEQEWFRHTGTLHLFAVSGLNLAMLAVFLSGVTRLFCAGPRWSALGVLPVLAMYASVTGGSPSCVRALVMSVMGLMVCWVGRPARALNSLGTAAVLLLLWDGNVLFRPAFQLSFWLVVVLASLVQPIARPLRRWAEPDPLLPRAYWTTAETTRSRMWYSIADAAAVSVAAWAASFPAAVLLFHEITPVALLANLLLTPLAFATLALGFLALFMSPLGWVFEPVSAVSPALNRINGMCAGGVLGIVRFCSTFPGAHYALADPWRRVPHFTVFDVGEGAAVMVRNSDSTVLFDCGREAQVRKILQPALRLYGIEALDLVLFSHGDVNHVGGGRVLLEEFSVRSVVLPALRDRSAVRRRLEEWLWQKPSIDSEHVSAPWRRDFPAGGTLEVLFPPADLHASLADDKALVVRWSSPQGSLLYTADAGFPTELWLLRHCADRLASDIWVRGQHDRERTGLEDFVRAVSPKVIILGYPARKAGEESQQQWAQKWIREGKTVFFQKQAGAVEGFWRGTEWEVRGFCGGAARSQPASGEHPVP